MKRRDFIKLGTAGVAGMAATGIPFSQGKAEPRPLGDSTGGVRKKAMMLSTFKPKGDLALVRKFQLLKDAGFDGVEPPSGLERDEVVRARDETGLEIPSVVVATHWAQPLSHPDPAVREAGLDGIKIALEDAEAYGAGAILLVPGVVNAEVSYDAAYRRSQLEIRKVIPMAEDRGVTIAIENVWNQFLLSPLEASRYIDEFESPQIGWYLDVGNLLNYGWPEHWIRILGERIKRVHVKEFSRQKRDKEGLWAGFRVNLTEGDNDWAAIMKAFREIGYDGYFIAEPPHRDRGLADDVWLKEYIAGRMDAIFAMEG